MRTKEGGHLSFLTNSGNYQQQVFQKDVKRLTQYYYTKGFVTVRVGSPTVELSKDKRFLSITIPVDEGEKFYAGSVDISGELLFDKSKLREHTKMREGDLFDYSQVSKDVRELMRVYQDEGYANANVTPLTSINRKDETVDLKYNIEKGRKVYFGRVEIQGNTKTRDPVIRRELEFQEGQLYSKTDIQESKAALRRLGFFKNIKFRTREGTTPKKVKVIIELDERQTGQFQIGAGFSSTESFVGNARISQDNLFGRGQSLSLQAQISGIRQQFNLRFREPWFMGSRWQFSFELFNSSLLFNDFSEQRTGGSITMGYPISEAFDWNLENSGELRVEGTYQLQDVELAPGGRTGQATSTSGSFFRGGLTSSMEFRTTYDTRNNVLFPTDGQLHWASVEYADDPLTLSQNEFIKYDGQVRWYFPLIWKFALRLSAEMGYVASTNPNQPVPLSERYLVGGPRTVRGFERYTLGGSRSVATSTTDPGASLTGFNIGGNKQLIFTGEIQFPILRAAGLKGVLFADAGNGFSTGRPYSLRMDLFSSPKNSYRDVLRTAVGFGFRWRSPIAPLRFEWGFPLERLRSEKPVVFEFSFGRAF
jgi:outer membrane protein insertion porin family